MRGLKLFCLRHCSSQNVVAPCVGAWIETTAINVAYVGGIDVAPCVGAWIETRRNRDLRLIGVRRTLRGCVD